jgi:hypothetical protein
MDSNIAMDMDNTPFVIDKPKVTQAFEYPVFLFPESSVNERRVSAQAANNQALGQATTLHCT